MFDAMESVETAELRVAEVIGSLMEFWGFKAVMGRIWGVLYLAPEPLSPDPERPGGMAPESVPVRWEVAPAR